MVNDQLDAQFFSMYLFQFSTLFEQPRAHRQENQLYQYNIWYMLLRVGDRFVRGSERNIYHEQADCRHIQRNMKRSKTALT